MPRPTTKTELLNSSQENFKKLNALIDSFADEKQEKEFLKGMLNRNIRDVIAHLHEWHILMKNWYRIGMKGGKPYMPAKGYSWKSLPELNKVINEKYCNMPLKEARSLFYKSYNDIQRLIKKHRNDELFEKKYCSWTGTTSLGAYFISNTSSHYNWAYNLIKKALK